jgi:hypothetical protein
MNIACALKEENHRTRQEIKNRFSSQWLNAETIRLKTNEQYALTGGESGKLASCRERGFAIQPTCRIHH